MLCCLVGRLEFQGMGEVASPKTLDAGMRINELLNFGNSGEEIYDRFINPKFKVNHPPPHSDKILSTGIVLQLTPQINPIG